MIRSTPTLQGHNQRMKHIRLDQKIKIQLHLKQERFPLYSCNNCICGDAANRSASAPRLT